MALEYVKISWTPPLVQAVSLDESHFLSLDESAFNMGTGDFGIDALLKVGSTPADTESWIVAKGTQALTSAAGWCFFYEKTLLRLGLRINDGGATPLVVYSNSGVFALDADFWAGVTVDRDGNATFYVNGVAVGGGAVSSISGSLDNAEEIKVGAYDATHNRHKGSIGFLRIDQGRVLPATWFSKEWDRVRYGYPIYLQDFLALWDFEGTLLDLSELYTFTWNGGGDEAYVDGYPYTIAPLELLLSKGKISFGGDDWELEAEDSERSLDGTLNSYSLYTKRRLTWPGESLNFSEVIALRAAKISGNLIDVYKDSNHPRDWQGFIMEVPEFKEDFQNIYSGELVVEEA